MSPEALGDLLDTRVIAAVSLASAVVSDLGTDVPGSFSICNHTDAQ